jgi:hypothetical protein
MSLFTRAIVTPFILFAITIGGSIVFQHRLIEKWRNPIYRYRDALYLPSSDYIRAITMGYDQFASDFLWLRMIQSFAAGYTRPENAEQMMGYFRVITDLDPNFHHAYSFSMLAVGEEAKRDDLAQEVVDKFIETNPHRFEIPKEGAYHAWWIMKNTPVSVFYIDMAKLDPTCPEYLSRWRDHILAGSGHYQIAYESKLMNTIKYAARQDIQIFAIEDRKLSILGVDWIREQIRERAAAWEKETGIAPTVRQLEESGKLKGLVSPDWMEIYTRINHYLEADAPSEPPADEELQKYAEQNILEWDTMPPNPHDIFMNKYPEYGGFIIWPFWEPENKNYILTKYEALDLTLKGLDTLDQMGRSQRDENGGLCPLTLEDVLSIGNSSIDDYPDSDPFGGEWIWDPELCESLSGSIPNIRELELPSL